MDPTRRAEAVAELVGGIAHGLLRVFHIAAQTSGLGPTMALRERQASFAVEEFERYRVLRVRLGELTSDPERAVDRFRPSLDAFYREAPVGSWLDAQVFHFVGNGITADFAEMLAPQLDPGTGAALRRALTGRDAHDAFALEQIDAAIAGDGEGTAERVATVAGEIVGRALNHLRAAVLESDVLALVLGSDADVKTLVLELLGRHRERLERLGLERVD